MIYDLQPFLIQLLLEIMQMAEFDKYFFLQQKPSYAQETNNDTLRKKSLIIFFSNIVLRKSI
jgi:hypothetical protein